ALKCAGTSAPGVLSADGRKLIGAIGGTLEVLDVATGANISPVAEAPYRSMNSLVFSPDGKTLVTGDIAENSAFRFWEVTTGKPLETLNFPDKAYLVWETRWPEAGSFFAQELPGRLHHWKDLVPREKVAKPYDRQAVRVS